MPPNPEKVLDIGCGEGLLSEAIKEKFPKAIIWGVEIEPNASQEAEKRLDHVLNASFSKELFKEERFDLILMADVIEHVENPETFLLDAKELLSQGGVLVASVPNIRNLKVLWALVAKGRFTYTDEGILDRTHRWFFTRKELELIFEKAGFKIETIKVENFEKKALLAHNLGCGLFDDFLTSKFYVRAT